MPSSPARNPSRRSLFALDGTNFLLADVQGGIAPFLSIYLLSSLNWSPGMIGVAVSAAGIATVLVQTPAGALIDRITWKRHLMALAMLLIAAASAATVLNDHFLPIVTAQAVIGAAGAFLTPMIAALTLGMVGYDRLSGRQGRNQVFNHAGNLTAAVSAGLMGYYVARAKGFSIWPRSWGWSRSWPFTRFANAISIIVWHAVRRRRPAVMPRRNWASCFAIGGS